MPQSVHTALLLLLQKATVLGCTLLWIGMAIAGELDIQADDVHYDAETKRYVATGSVKVARDGWVLLAKRVEYDQTAGMIHAFGAVQLRTIDGTVLYADEMHVDETLTQESAIEFSAETLGKSRFAATKVTKEDETSRHFEHYVYTPCARCNDDPNTPPVWQVTAEKAEHNLETRDYIIHNAVVEFGGWPVFYTPYFSYPDSSAKRRSGFLSPTYGSSTDFGQYIVTPYFFDLGLDKNLLITPTLATKAGAVTDLHYTQAFDTGSATLNASYGRLDLGKGAGKQAVGHYEASLVLRPQPNVEVGGSLRHNSNPGYLARLPIKSSTFTTLYSSDLYWRQYGLNHPRNRLEATAISYRDHRSSVTVDQAPRFVPELNGQFYGDTDAYGGRFQHNFAARHIQQEEFAHTQSLSAASNYQIGRVHRYGVVGNYQAGVDLSYFRYRSDRTGLKSGSKILAYPRAHASWRLPYQRDFDNATGVFEPIAGFSVTPGAINSNTLPNQDAGLLANNETLLFSSEKISGRTRRDDSTRLSLAVEYDHYWHSGTIASLLMGRSFELRAPSLSTNDAALRRFEKRDDDYIVRLRLNHRNGLFIEDRLSIDNDNNNQINAHEVETSWKNMAWNITPSLDYAYHRPDDVRKLAGRHQFTAGFTKTFGQYWALKGSTHYDLNHTEEKFRNRQLRLRYEDECLKIVAYYKRDKHVSRYLNQEQVWGMNFDLKFGG